jgi:predicted DNA-binding protein (MmcQ/YjbR family)
MNIEELREYCITKEDVEESFPFDEVTLVFKTKGKMFLLCGLEHEPLSFNVKCDPEKAIELREQYPCVQPGYHMSKTHWNTIICDGSVPDKLLKQWIDDSYEIIMKSAPKKKAAPKKKDDGKPKRKFGDGRKKKA